MGEWSLQQEVANNMLEIPAPSKEPPRVFVGSYGRYTEGFPKGYGKWWDLSEFNSREEFYAALNEHFSQWEPETEPMFMDYECMPGEYYSEGGIDEALWEEYLSTPEEDRDIAAYAAYNGCSLEDAKDSVFGPYESLEDLVNESIDLFGIRGVPVPEELRFYIDEELVLRELALEGTLVEIGNRYYLFRP